jgi:hypothetical protein
MINFRKGIIIPIMFHSHKQTKQFLYRCDKYLKLEAVSIRILNTKSFTKNITFILSCIFEKKFTWIQLAIAEKKLKDGKDKR